jgi:hypothetical protein
MHVDPCPNDCHAGKAANDTISNNALDFTNSPLRNQRESQTLTYPQKKTSHFTDPSGSDY